MRFWAFISNTPRGSAVTLAVGLSVGSLSYKAWKGRHKRRGLSLK
jgi:hypothetical protein